jgi:hypothetical protein
VYGVVGNGFDLFVQAKLRASLPICFSRLSDSLSDESYFFAEESSRLKQEDMDELEKNPA